MGKPDTNKQKNSTRPELTHWGEKQGSLRPVWKYVGGSAIGATFQLTNTRRTLYRELSEISVKDVMDAVSRDTPNMRAY